MKIKKTPDEILKDKFTYRAIDDEKVNFYELTLIEDNNNFIIMFSYWKSIPKKNFIGGFEVYNP